MFVHLTNVAIQKHADAYNSKHGGKWSVQSLKFYLDMCYGKQASDKCFEDMNKVIIQSLKSCQGVMINDKHCFECYGYDILIDNKLKPWLVEVNASPSLTTTSEKDRITKSQLIHDIFNIVMPNDWLEEGYRNGANSCKKKSVGYFDVLLDESISEGDRNRGKGTRKTHASMWR